MIGIILMGASIAMILKGSGLISALGAGLFLWGMDMYISDKLRIRFEE